MQKERRSVGYSAGLRSFEFGFRAENMSKVRRQTLSSETSVERLTVILTPDGWSEEKAVSPLTGRSFVFEAGSPFAVTHIDMAVRPL